ncbi:hypothetical protein [Prosthecomicrobium sp. N25]|uniref:hypothetical protein n=1 Tax=Prosthecomicrobium sp. N25 TaxID=3129254 RepID=UPI0030772EB2
MKHESLDALRQTADVVPVVEGKLLTRRERLERWADLLEHHDGAVRPLSRVEFVPADERKTLRGDDTPLAIAFSDPVLRAAGMPSDRYGDGKGFFELSENEAHHILCNCHYAGGMSGPRVAARIRAAANRGTAAELFYKARDALFGRFFHRHA